MTDSAESDALSNRQPPALSCLFGGGEDPFVHLAREQYLMQRTDRSVLYLWVGRPSVVIGRHQNPWLECDVEALESDGLDLVRRESGGGTVFHDVGNLNYAFIRNSDEFDMDEQARFVVSVLDEWGIRADVGPRYDILVGGKKVGGAAFRHSKGRSLHHGTLLVSADLEALARYLTVRDGDIEGTRIASVRSQTTNLSDIVPRLDIPGLVDGFRRRSEGALSLAEDVEPWIEAHAAFLRSETWRFGKTPPFEKTIERSGHTLRVRVEAGRIVSVSPPGVLSGLVGSLYRRSSLEGR